LIIRLYLGAARHVRGKKLEMAQPDPTTASQMIACVRETQEAANARSGSEERERVETVLRGHAYHGGWWRSQHGEPLLEHDDERATNVLYARERDGREVSEGGRNA
jgi:hypothetical protein